MEIPLRFSRLSRVKKVEKNPDLGVVVHIYNPILRVEDGKFQASLGLHSQTLSYKTKNE
jgi:hypothetical protein